MKTLYIIGNGFDVAHGLPSRYEDFYIWLEEHEHQYFIENMEWFFSHWDRDGKRDLLWNDFEKALGTCNFEEVYSIFADQSREYFGEGYEYLRDIGNVSNEHFVLPLTYEMPDLFTKWIESVNAAIQNIQQANLKLKNIGEKDLFLTFNYTDTLELLYGLPSTNICHIHNSVSAGEQPIVGHNMAFKIVVPYDMTKEESKLKQSLADVLNSYKKDYKRNISKNDDFFKQVDQDVDKIYIYGHSLGEIDLPYFKNIKKRVRPDVQWQFYIYKGKDDEQLMRNKNVVLEFIRIMHLDKQKCNAYDSEFMNQKIRLY